MASHFRGHRRGQQKKRPNPFKPYWADEALRRGDLIQGVVRVNQWNYEESYVSPPDGVSDIVLCGIGNRNRALNGDMVAVHLNPQDEWNVHKDNLESYLEQLAKENSAIAQEYDLRKEFDNLCISGGGSGQAPRSRYITVNDLLKSGDCSPSMQRLLSAAMTDNIALSTRFLQRTGVVVGIIERKHPRVCVGYLKPMRDNNPNKALLQPTDSRVPRLMINMTECPPGFRQRPGAYEKTLFMADITDWPEFSSFANGRLGNELGLSGEIEVEEKVIMMDNNVDNSEFSAQALSHLQQWLPWTVPQEEVDTRPYFEKRCIFTVDGESTLDCDDGISCRHIGNGLYEVGIHIADVTYFIPENSHLDKEAAARATCVHLVNKRAPMLPRVLREDICSLNPGIPRLAFSVIWTMSETGEIRREQFSRTIVRSCCKFTYDHAQAVIDLPDKAWTKEELPPITNGFNVNDITQAVLFLDMIAKNLRQQRFSCGALRLQKIHLRDTLDPVTGLPTGYNASQPTDANDMIEEFSLLANMAVAKIIKDVFPRIALLHRHPSPWPKMLSDMESLCKEMGIDMDTTSSATINSSLVKFSKSSLFSYGRQQVLYGIVARCLQRAQYFCTANNEDEAFYHHYSLNLPIYSHFTSPIRSYPDIMVHRILSAALENSAAPSTSAEEMQRRADHCNDKISASKQTEDLGYNLYLAKFIRDAHGIEEEAIVSVVTAQSFEIIILRFGVTKRVLCRKLSLEVKSFSKEKDVPVLMLTKSGNDHKIMIFTKVKAVLSTCPGSLQWDITAINFN